MNGKKLQLKKKPVRVLDSLKLENVTGGLAPVGTQNNLFDPPPPGTEEQMLTKTRCVGESGGG